MAAWRCELAPSKLAILNNAAPEFRFKVIEKGKLFYCQHDQYRAQFEYETFRDYQDTAFLRQEFHRVMVRAIREDRFWVDREIIDYRLAKLRDRANRLNEFRVGGTLALSHQVPPLKNLEPVQLLQSFLFQRRQLI